MNMSAAQPNLPIPVHAASRLAYLDQLKLWLVSLVVVHHAGQPYGPPEEWPLRSATADLPLGAFFEINGAFFMGLFFLISAVFLPMAVDRDGVRKTMSSRFVRLGTPLVVMSVLVFGPISYFTKVHHEGFITYMLRDYLGRAAFQVGHLWFLSWLLVMCLSYGGWRLTVRLWTSSPAKPPGHSAILGAVALLIVANTILRIWFPVGVWVDLAPLVTVEVGRLPQYVFLFIMGLATGRFGWLESFPLARGLVWLALGLAAAGLRLLQPWLVPMPPWAWRVEEAVIGVGLSIGLLVLFRVRWGHPSQVFSGLARDAFAVYLIHVFLVVALQFAFEAVPINAYGRFAAVSVLGVITSIALAHGLLRVPGVRRFL